MPSWEPGMPTNSDFEVITDAFENEARKWEELSDEMSALRDATAGLNLMPSAFFCGNPGTAFALSKGYDEVYELVRQLMVASAAEFDEIARALRIAADRYDGTDQQSAGLLVDIYGRGYKQ